MSATLINVSQLVCWRISLNISWSILNDKTCKYFWHYVQQSIYLYTLYSIVIWYNCHDD